VVVLYRQRQDDESPCFTKAERTISWRALRRKTAGKNRSLLGVDYEYEDLTRPKGTVEQACRPRARRPRNLPSCCLTNFKPIWMETRTLDN